MSICKLSLETKDFDRYDVVADKKLYRSEMTDEQFECLVQQLIRTSDREVRKSFVDAMQNKLWEAVRKKLGKLARNPTLTSDIRKRIRSLLKHEFTGATISGSASVMYSLDYYRTIDSNSSGKSKEVDYFQRVRGRGDLKLNIPFSQWRIISNMALTGSFRASTVQYVSADSITSNNNSRYMGMSAESDIKLVKRNSRFALLGKAFLDKNWNAPPDQVATNILTSGSLSLRHPFGSGFSLYAFGEFNQKRYAAPLDPSYNIKKINSSSANAQASYLFKKGGIITTYDFKDNDNTSNFYRSRTKQHAASVLAHIRMKKGYIRIGGGGGALHEEFLLVGESNDTVSRGADAHVDAIAQWRPRSWLTAKLRVSGAANRSEGAFNGWYPSYLGKLDMTFSGKRSSGGVFGSYSGKRRDLEFKQTLHSTSVGANYAYRLNDRFNASLTATFDYSEQLGHQPYSEWMFVTLATVGIKLHETIDLWTSISLGYVRYHFLSDSNERDQDNVWASASIAWRH